jgi:hypothetical protein
MVAMQPENTVRGKEIERMLGGEMPSASLQGWAGHVVSMHHVTHAVDSADARWPTPRRAS